MCQIYIVITTRDETAGSAWALASGFEIRFQLESSPILFIFSWAYLSYFGAWSTRFRPGGEEFDTTRSLSLFTELDVFMVTTF